MTAERKKLDIFYEFLSRRQIDDGCCVEIEIETFKRGN